MVKAIETRFKGYRFRSRLEARYAVLFDALGMEWEYEPEGFDLGEAGWYLPDFYLPECNAWAEVKAKTLNAEEREKAFALSSHTGEQVIELCSLPDPGLARMCGSLVVNHYVGADMSGAMDNFFAKDLVGFYAEKNGISPADLGKNALRDALAWDMRYYRKRHGKEHPTHFANGMILKSEAFVFGKILGAAVAKARSARFEHGETP